MSVYIHDIPLDQAQKRFEEALAQHDLGGILGEESIALDDMAIGRVTSRPVWAEISSPHYHASAMDGFALRAQATTGAIPSKPVVLQAGEEAVYVDTGDPLPDWANAVVPIENVEPLDGNDNPADDPRHPVYIRLRAALTPWSHVRPLGEDIVATQLVLPSGQVLRPVDLGAMAACGHTKVWVSRKPKVAVLPTGTELVPLGKPVKRGDIIEYNSIVLAGQVRGWGAEPDRYPITIDNLDAIRVKVQEAADTHDLVILNAGSSAGSEDFSARVVEDLGLLLVHGVAVRPGHPVILGLIHRSQKAAGLKGEWAAVVGAPGYPVSAALTGEIFIEPLIARWLGRPVNQPIEVSARLTRKVTSPGGDDDYMRVVAGKVGDQLLAAPLSRGAGVISSLVKADGLVILPRGVQGLEAGADVKVRLYTRPKDLESTIFVIGSHDMTLDLLSQFLAMRGRRLVSANVGSQGGLVALRRKEAHLAGSHLLDPESGEYNVRFIRQYLENEPVWLVDWVGREQGLMVCKGNPKGIHNLQDLTRPDVNYINRQRGAGTRVLLDYHLEKLGIQPEQVSGYDQEEYTHLAVAAAVASGRGDCGLGIAAAAKALDLEFLPLYNERYQLVIPQAYAESDLLAPIFELATDVKFRKEVSALPGYDITLMGKVAGKY